MRKHSILPLVTAGFLAAAGLGLAACNQPQDAPESVEQAGEEEAEVEDNEGGEDGDDAMGAGDPEKGKTHFAVCAGCHGMDAKGLPNLGKSLVASAFVADQTDAELIAFLKIGRAADDPLNTTGVAMPPKGGNPALDDEDLQDLVAYLRTLQ